VLGQHTACAVCIRARKAEQYSSPRGLRAGVASAYYFASERSKIVSNS